MNDEARELFLDMLCSLKGTNLKEDADLPNKVLLYPKYIYRFRAVFP